MIDLEAIRRKVAQLQGGRRSSNVQFWKPEVGKHNVRAIPWPDTETKDGQPFVERWFYYIGENRGMLAPFQFDKEDPISDLRKKLYDGNDPADREIAKKLKPKMRCYMLLIDRDKPDDGVQIYSFGKIVYQRLLGFFLEEDTEDWMDVNTGRDLKITITQKPNSQWKDTQIDLSFKPTPLAESDEALAKLTENLPSINDVYRERSTEEIEKVLNEWLTDAEGEGTSRGDGGNDALTDLVNEVKGATEAKEEPAAEEKKPAKRTRKKKEKPAAKAAASELDEVFSDPVPAQNLDAAFDELMNDD